jgi:ribosomal protein L7/L12
MGSAATWRWLSIKASRKTSFRVRIFERVKEQQTVVYGTRLRNDSGADTARMKRCWLSCSEKLGVSAAAASVVAGRWAAARGRLRGGRKTEFTGSAAAGANKITVSKGCTQVTSLSLKEAKDLGRRRSQAIRGVNKRSRDHQEEARRRRPRQSEVRARQGWVRSGAAAPDTRFVPQRPFATSGGFCYDCTNASAHSRLAVRNLSLG